MLLVNVYTLDLVVVSLKHDVDSFFFNPHRRTHSLIFKERGREGERERNIDVREYHRSVAPWTHSDQELNQRPFSLQDSAQSTEPHWSGLDLNS